MPKFHLGRKIPLARVAERICWEAQGWCIQVEVRSGAERVPPRGGDCGRGGERGSGARSILALAVLLALAQSLSQSVSGIDSVIGRSLSSLSRSLHPSQCEPVGVSSTPESASSPLNISVRVCLRSGLVFASCPTASAAAEMTASST